MYSETYFDDIKTASEKNDLGFLRNKTILITGATGLICSTVADMILFLNHQYGFHTTLCLAGRREAAIRDRFPDASDIVFLPFDATKPEKPAVDLDYIIHGAGNSSPDLYITKPVETMVMNIDGLRCFLEYAKENTRVKLLYISSSEVYGKKQDVGPFQEDMTGVVDFNGIRSSYAVSKRASETLGRSYHAEYSVNVVFARPGHVYGPTCRKEDKRVVSEFLMNAAQKKDITLKSAGLQKRSYMYCVDCAAALLKVLEKGICGEAYNIASDDVITIREMAEMISSIANVRLYTQAPSETEQMAFNPMNDSSLDNTKLKALGFLPCFSPREGLSHSFIGLKEMGKSI